jgi:hypothetical protein
MNSNNNKPEEQKSELQKVIDNRAEQLNPTSDKYWLARGLNERPENWKELLNEPKKTK